MGLGNTLKGYVNTFVDRLEGFVNRADRYIHTVKNILDYGSWSMDAALYRSPGLVGVFRNCSFAGEEMLRRFYDAGERLFRKNSEHDMCCDDYDAESLSRIISMKNKYFWKSNERLEDVLVRETDIRLKNNQTMGSLMRDAMRLKVEDKRYENLPRINYDSRIAPLAMKKDIYRMYVSSAKTLKDLAADLEKTYGMHISVSTFSVNARRQLAEKGLDFRNRREAKRYYSQYSPNLF